ncbi:hypothetical protein FA15DRAFT_711844 [Coprinopsis marcescibilis]|uniref:Uncharacterized protein n=1 Tax=Coprinopsis marcescibilis TaxID=230819 RepID=A0A5C3K963_COPMA|nr:hypothetical protein FA15DRAFT_711844 [Coprinopsis marcescibilis]
MGEEVNLISYGELQLLLVCSLPDSAIFEKYAAKTHVLAVIQPCNTRGKDAQQELVSFKDFKTPVAIDVQKIQELVTVFNCRGLNWIIDQLDSTDLPTFDYLNEKNREVMHIVADDEDEDE